MAAPPPPFSSPAAGKVPTGLALLLARARQLQVMRDYHGAADRCFEYLHALSSICEETDREEAEGGVNGGGGGVSHAREAAGSIVNGGVGGAAGVGHQKRCEGRTCECFPAICQVLQLLPACGRHGEMLPFLSGWYGDLARIPAFALSICVLGLAQSERRDEAENAVYTWLRERHLYAAPETRILSIAQGARVPSLSPSSSSTSTSTSTTTSASASSFKPSLGPATTTAAAATAAWTDDGLAHLVAAFVHAVLLPSRRCTQANSLLECLSSWLPSPTLLELREVIRAAAEAAAAQGQGGHGEDTHPSHHLSLSSAAMSASYLSSPSSSSSSSSSALSPQKQARSGRKTAANQPLAAPSSSSSSAPPPPSSSPMGILAHFLETVFFPWCENLCTGLGSTRVVQWLLPRVSRVAATLAAVLLGMLFLRWRRRRLRLELKKRQ